ncbi:hypothetical protein ACTQXY_11100 [Faecalimonas sp. LCP19S3_D12]
MNKRIRKKIAKRQIAEAIQGLVDFAYNQKRQQEEIIQQLAEAFGRYYEQKRGKEELTQSPM